MSSVTCLERAQKSSIKKVWMLRTIDVPDDDEYAPCPMHPEVNKKNFSANVALLKAQIKNPEKTLFASMLPLDLGMVGRSCRIISENFSHSALIVCAHVEANLDFFNTGQFLNREYEEVVVLTNMFGVHNLIDKYRWYATGKGYELQKTIPREDGPWSSFGILSVMDIAQGKFYSSVYRLPENQLQQAA